MPPNIEKTKSIVSPFLSKNNSLTNANTDTTINTIIVIMKFIYTPDSATSHASNKKWSSLSAPTFSTNFVVSFIIKYHQILSLHRNH